MEEIQKDNPSMDMVIRVFKDGKCVVQFPKLAEKLFCYEVLRKAWATIDLYSKPTIIKPSVRINIKDIKNGPGKV